MLERLSSAPAAVERVDAIEMQVHPRFLFGNGLTDEQYCRLETWLRQRFELVYRFAYVWELWVRRGSHRRHRYWKLHASRAPRPQGG